jgi:hypothetical protein
MGHSKWASANDILKFCMTAIDGGDPRTQAGEAADWGNLLESTIIGEMAARLGLDRFTFPQEAFHHPDVPLSASLDAVGHPGADGLVIKHNPAAGIYVVGADEIELAGVGVLESKLTRGYPEETPPLYRGPIQVQGCMMCAGMDWAAIGTLFSGVELRIYLFKAHETTQQAITNTAEDFNRRLLGYKAGQEIEWYPPQDSKDADRVWSQANDEAIDLGENFEAIASAINDFKAQKKIIDEQIGRHETELKKVMQEFSSAKAGRYTINWPMRHYKATPEKITPPKEAYSIRQSTLTIKETK